MAGSVATMESETLAGELSSPDIGRPVRIYLAGPMRGYPDYNRPVFRQAADRLRQLGFEVYCPDEDAYDGSWAAPAHYDAMRRNFTVLLDCDALVVLPGWERSRGAKAEIEVARQIGLPVVNLHVVLQGNLDLDKAPTLTTFQLELARAYTAHSAYLDIETGD